MGVEMKRTASFLTLILSFLALINAWAGEQRYSGQVVIYSRSIQIQGDAALLTYDDQVYTVTGIESDGSITATRALNSKDREDITILQDPDVLNLFRSSPQKTAEEFHLQNAKEVRCTSEHNAIFTLTRTMGQGMVSYGNCFTLTSTSSD